MFALALAAKGYDRRVIMTALSMEETQLSRLMAVGRSLPSDLVEAIGPAPKAGRPRWVRLGEILPVAKAVLSKRTQCHAEKLASGRSKFRER